MGVWRSQVARRAFNPLVVGSNPTTPALNLIAHKHRMRRYTLSHNRCLMIYGIVAQYG